MQTRLPFSIDAQAPDSGARAATLVTPHGQVPTPVFMPVGTQATVKCQTLESLRGSGSTVILANTYHLMLRPGQEVFEQLGGIHRFMQWDGPILTDSGGFQIFSLPHAYQMSEEGARFQSYVDGRWWLLSPETSIAMQKAIGSDIMMPLDHCIPSTASKTEALAAMERTHRWAERSLEARGESPQALFGIVQGAAFPDLRRRSADFLTCLPFDGYSVGGLAVGESRAQREDLTEATTKRLPRDRPRYLMGVGTPVDILEAVHRGVDMFDCIIPTMLAQRGTAYTSEGRLHIRRGWYRLQDAPLDPQCECPTCRRYSRAYLQHLIKAEESLGWHLVGQHNLYFYHRMMREIRAQVLEGQFIPYYREKRETWARVDGDDPGVRHPKPRRSCVPHLGDYEVHRSSRGFSSIRQRSTGEIMHSVSNPMEEAQRLYVDQSQLAARLRQTEAPELVLWDVGLGAATNAMAAVRSWERVLAEEGKVRPMRIVSFERDLDPLRLAIAEAAYFPHLHHAAPSSLLRKGAWQHKTGALQWLLLTGDFLELMDAAPKPHLIYYDLFSYKSNGPAWTTDLFERLFRLADPKETALFTYTNSTAIRAAMLWAGFYVARGIATGPKTETTVACTDPAFLSLQAEDPPPLLDLTWLGRWERSGSPYPSDVPLDMQVRFEAHLRAHPQFQLKTPWDEDHVRNDSNSTL